MDCLEKWENHGITGVRAVLAEAATAQFASSKAVAVIDEASATRTLGPPPARRPPPSCA
jgi:hypothetical protein